MKTNFHYKKRINVANIEDLTLSLEENEGCNYYAHEVINHMPNILAITKEDSIEKIELIGEELIYLKVYYTNRPMSTISMESYKTEESMFFVELIETDLVKIENSRIKNENIKNFFVITDESMELDLEEDKDVLKEKLSEIFRRKINKVTNYYDEFYKLNYYDGNLKILINNLKFKSSDAMLYKTDALFFGVNDNGQEIDVIILDKQKRT